MVEVVLRGLCKRFGGTEVLCGIDLTVPSGAFCVLVGPSGCGKSTLLRMIAGLEEIDEGELLIGGRRMNALAPARRGVAMVFQNYALYPHMTARQNMAFGLRLARTAAETAGQRIARAAEMLELTPLLDRLPRELSGGQRQRVAIGRALVREPQVFLFDEPLSNLDAALRLQTRVEIARLHRRLGTTTIYVTHDQAEAMTLADVMAVMHEGRIAQAGPPLQLYREPANRFVAGFLGSPSMNLLAVQQVAARDGRMLCRLADGSEVATLHDAGARSRPATLGIRPEDVRLGPPGSGTLFEVVLVEQLGESHLVHLAGAAASGLVARGAGAGSLAAGERVGLCFPPAACHLFDANGDAIRPG